MKKTLLFITLMVLAMAGIASAGVVLNGAGATFPYPLYSKWFYTYEKTAGTKINYQSIGSGGGINQVKVGTVDFGASDAPLTGKELAEASLFQFPTVAGAVAVIYNVPGAPSGLKLSSQTVADIFMGKIKKWNDPAIAKTNPGVALPSFPVIPIHRSDGSGTTNLFTWYLEDVSPEWKSKIGSGKAVNWPGGIGAKGNEGISGIVRQTRGAIGYVEMAYAAQNKMAYAALSNKDGNFVLPTTETVNAASANAKIPSDYFVRFTYAPGKNAYPCSGFTYILVKTNGADKAKVGAFKDFVKWAFKNGDKDAKDLMFVPLPAAIKKSVLTDLDKKVK